MPLIAQFIQDGSSESRTHGRRAIVTIIKLLNSPDVESIFRKYLPEPNLKRVMEVVEKLSPVQSRAPKVLATPSPTVKPRVTPLSSPYQARVKGNLSVI
jgi:hypothetical protein